MRKMLPRGRPIVQVPPKYPGAINDLLAHITDGHPETVVSDALDVSVAAVSNWKRRGIPQRHWPTIAKLTGLPLAEVAVAHDAKGFR